MRRARADDDLHPAIQAAVYFLKMTLFELGKCSWAQLSELAADEDIAEITLRRARRLVPLIRKPNGPRQWLWSLPRTVMSQLHSEW